MKDKVTTNETFNDMMNRAFSRMIIRAEKKVKEAEEKEKKMNASLASKK